MARSFSSRLASASRGARPGLRAHLVDIELAFVVLVWGFSPNLFKIALQELQPLAFTFLRFVTLSALAVGVLAWRGAHGKPAWRVPRRDIPWLVVSGLSGYGFYQLGYMVGLAHTTVFASALLVSTTPLWSALILTLTRAERIAPAQWLGILVSLGGVTAFLLTAQPHGGEGALHHTFSQGEMLLGDALSLGAAGLFALYGVVNKRLGERYSPPELMCYTLLAGTLALAPFGVPALLQQHWQLVTWRSWLILPYSVLFPIYLTYSLWNWAIARRGVGYVTLYSYAVPVVGGIVAVLLLRETLTAWQGIAAVVVLGGMLTARWAATRVRRAGAWRDAPVTPALAELAATPEAEAATEMSAPPR